MTDQPVKPLSPREALATMAPVHVGQMYSATDKGGVEYRPDDCLYRGEVLATLDAARAEPLDVERLARAAESVGIHELAVLIRVIEHDHPDRLATEYARLATAAVTDPTSR